MADGFWGSRNERAFFDVRVFNPFAPLNSSESIATVYRKDEWEKKRECGPHVREVEHGTFTPLVMSSTGGPSREASTFCKQLASLIAEKRNQSYSQTISYIRYCLSFFLLCSSICCYLSFSLLRSSIRCIRGHQSVCGQPVRIYLSPIDVVSSESRIAGH